MGIPDELKLRQHVHLGDFTTWKVGGDAEYFAEPDSGEELQALVQWGQEQQLPLRFIGAGSNLLISDPNSIALQESSKLRLVNRCQRWPGVLLRPA